MGTAKPKNDKLTSWLKRIGYVRNSQCMKWGFRKPAIEGLGSSFPI